MSYPIFWVASPKYGAGRRYPVIAIVHHRMVGTLRGTDATFTTGSRQASTNFGVGYGCEKPGHPLGVHVHQYVNLDDAAWGNGNWDASGQWDDRYPTTAVNARTISIEHHDNGHLNMGDPKKGVVPDSVIAASIWLDALLLNGDVASWRQAGIRWRDDANAKRIADELQRIVVGPHTLIDHHYVSGKLKPSCWRPWASDPAGFPQARYIAALGSELPDTGTGGDVPTLTPDETLRYGTNARPKVGVALWKVPGVEKYRDTRAGDTFPLIGKVTNAPGDYYAVRVPGNLTGYLAAGSVEAWEPIPDAAPDCTAAIEADRAKAYVAWRP